MALLAVVMAAANGVEDNIIIIVIRERWGLVVVVLEIALGPGTVSSASKW